MGRKFLLLCCLLFGAVSVAHPQGFRVSVLNDVKEPLPHAYIYVNGRVIAVADMLGRAIIPQEKLKIEDTISISYVATEGQSVVVDQDILSKGECHFILPEIHAALRSDEVVVTANADVDKLFRKYVKQLGAYREESIWTSDFLIHINISNNDGIASNPVSGKLKIGVKWPNFENEFPIGITTSDDTTNLAYILQRYLRNAFNNNLTALHLIKDQKYFETTAKLGYIGNDKKHRVFLLSYSELVSGITYQVMLKCDVKTGYIHDVTVDMINLKEGSTTYSKSTIRNTKQEKKRGVSSRYIPSEIVYRVDYNNGNSLNIMLTDIDCKSHKWRDKSIQQFIEEVAPL